MFPFAIGQAEIVASPPLPHILENFSWERLEYSRIKKNIYSTCYKPELTHCKMNVCFLKMHRQYLEALISMLIKFLIKNFVNEVIVITLH